MIEGDRSVPDALHVGAELMGDLLEHLLGEVATSDALVELHELHDVAHGRLPSRVSEAATVAIESLH